MDFYNILNVDKNATKDEIKKQYKKLALKHHPDRGGDPEMFKKISEAYQTLSDPNKRREYDNPNPFSQNNGRNHFHHPQNFVDPNIIFQNFFNNNGSFRHHPQAQNTTTFNIRVPNVRNNGGINGNISQKRTSIEIRGNIKTETTIEINNGVKIKYVKQTDMKTGKTITNVTQQIKI